MTLEELEDSLPNGLHDAEVQTLAMDYVRRTVTINLSVFVGNPDAPLDKREAYREATLVISGLLFATIEPPSANYPFAEQGSLRVDTCDRAKDLDSSLLKALPSKAFCRSLFVSEWNSFVNLAGLAAEIHWKGPVVYRAEREHSLPGEIVDL